MTLRIVVMSSSADTNNVTQDAMKADGRQPPPFGDHQPRPERPREALKIKDRIGAHHAITMAR